MVIDDISEIRWDAHPVNRLGTVEMRSCDGMSCLEEISAITAVTQCLVRDLSMSLEAGYGLDAIIIRNAEGDEMWELTTYATR